MNNHDILIGLGIIFFGFGPFVATALYIYFNMDKIFTIDENKDNFSTTS